MGQTCSSQKLAVELLGRPRIARIFVAFGSVLSLMTDAVDSKTLPAHRRRCLWMLVEVWAKIVQKRSKKGTAREYSRWDEGQSWR